MAKFPLNRRKFLALAGGAGVAAVAADSALIEPNRPRVVRRDILLGRWPERLDGFKIAVLADFHYDDHFSVHPIHAAIEMVNDLRADILVLVGDFVSLPSFSDDDRKGALAADPCARLLCQMHATHGLWAVLGNHDHYTDPAHVTAALQAQGIRVMNNQSAPIEMDGARFWLAGVNDVQGRAADLDKALHGVPSSEPTVLLAHEPDYADWVSSFPVDLQISGHSHGGQVRFPLLGPLYLPPLAKKYVWGMYQVGPLSLYTNPGLGTVGLPVRWNCPPEITLLTLRRSPAA